MTYRLTDVKILVVEDMQPMLSLTKSILNIFGFNKVYTAIAARLLELIGRPYAVNGHAVSISVSIGLPKGI